MTDSLFNTIIFLLILKTCEILNRIRQIIRSVKTPKIGLHELDNEGLSIMGSTGGDKVYHGLYNEGATCYLNSVLQVLFMTKVFREALECNSEEKYIVDFKLKRLFTTLMENETYTKDILLTLGIENVHEQCDAAEYFEKILSMVNPKASKLFKGELRHSTTCSNGRITSNEIGPFWTLPLSMADPLDSSNTYCVNDGFCDFFKSSTVSGENQMYCDDCEMKADATIECRMEVYPDILTLLLKRFEFDYYTMTYVKINRSVEVPHTLQTEEHDYELYAIVDHFGTLRGGHYTAKIKSFEDHNWYVFRDSYVKKLCFQPNSKRTERSNSAYLLVYKKSLVKNEHTTNQIPVNPGDEVAGEPVEIKTSEDDDPDDAGLEEHGHAVRTEQQTRLAMKDIGTAVIDETKQIDCCMLEQRAKYTAHWRKDVDEDGQILVKTDATLQQTQEIQKKLGKLRVLYHDYTLPITCSLGEKNNIVQNRHPGNFEEIGEPDFVVEKGEQDNGVRMVKECIGVKRHLNDSKTSLTMFKHSSSSTKCKSKVAHCFHMPDKFRGKSMQRGTEKRYSRLNKSRTEPLSRKSRKGGAER